MTGSAKQSIARHNGWMDCFVATLLAMTRLTEFSIPQKRNRLLDRTVLLHQKRVRGADNDMIGHSFEPGILNRHPAVMRPGQEYRRQRINRSISGNYADGIINRRQDRAQLCIPLRAKLLPGRAKESAIGAEILQ